MTRLSRRLLSYLFADIPRPLHALRREARHAWWWLTEPFDRCRYGHPMLTKQGYETCRAHTLRAHLDHVQQHGGFRLCARCSVLSKWHPSQPETCLDCGAPLRPLGELVRPLLEKP